MDSNIIIKLILNEPGSKEAKSSVLNYLKKGYSLCTVDIALAECLNVIWKHANLLADLERDMVESAVEDLKRVYRGLNVYSTMDLSEVVTDIALSQNIPVYDSLYIAAAQKANGTLYTADQKLNQTANKLLTQNC